MTEYIKTATAMAPGMAWEHDIGFANFCNCVAGTYSNLKDGHSEDVYETMSVAVSGNQAVITVSFHKIGYTTVGGDPKGKVIGGISANKGTMVNCNGVTTRLKIRQERNAVYDGYYDVIATITTVFDNQSVEPGVLGLALSPQTITKLEDCNGAIVIPVNRCDTDLDGLRGYVDGIDSPVVDALRYDDSSPIHAGYAQNNHAFVDPLNAATIADASYVPIAITASNLPANVEVTLLYPSVYDNMGVASLSATSFVTQENADGTSTRRWPEFYYGATQSAWQDRTFDTAMYRVWTKRPGPGQRVTEQLDVWHSGQTLDLGQGDTLPKTLYVEALGSAATYSGPDELTVAVYDPTEDETMTTTIPIIAAEIIAEDVVAHDPIDYAGAFPGALPGQRVYLDTPATTRTASTESHGLDGVVTDGA